MVVGDRRPYVASLITIDVDALLAAVTDRTRIIFLDTERSNWTWGTTKGIS